MNPIASTVSKGVGSLLFKVTIIAIAAIGGAGLVASNVFAALTATATNTSGGSVTTGTLKLELAPSGVSGITGGFISPISAMGPGDTVNRYIDLSNTGTLDGASPTLQIVSSDSNTLVNSPSAGLQVTITGCSIAWTNAGVCGGSSTSVLSATPVSTLKSSAQTITLPSVLVGGINYLKVSTALPAGTENVLNGVLPVGTAQGLTATLTWTFVIQERAATTTNN